MKMPIGTEVGLVPRHSVLDGDPAPPEGAQHPIHFSAYVYCGQRSPISASAELLSRCASGQTRDPETDIQTR